MEKCRRWQLQWGNRDIQDIGGRGMIAPNSAFALATVMSMSDCHVQVRASRPLPTALMPEIDTAQDFLEETGIQREKIRSAVAQSW